MEQCPAARSEGLLVESLGDELLIYDSDRDRAHSLNAVAAAVWELSDGRRSVAELAEAATAKLGDPVSEEAASRALSQLEERRLLVGQLPRRMSGRDFSRRQALARAGVIGATAAFAAPLVKSIVVPTAAYAQASCVPQGGTCGTKNGTSCDTSLFAPCCPVQGNAAICISTSTSSNCFCSVT
jgi:hypothetical protein